MSNKETKILYNNSLIMVPPVGMDGHPLRTEDDFREEKLRCESRIVMYQAINTVLAQGLKNLFKTANENK